MKTEPVVVIGAGIVGVSAALWLRRAGHDVVLVDRQAPGQGASFGNAGVLAASSVVPVTTPGLLGKAPRLWLDKGYPLFMRLSYLPSIAPWLMRYLSHATDPETRRIAAALLPLTADTVAQHRALAEGTGAEGFLRDAPYVYAYASRAAFEADAYVWGLRRAAGFVPELVEGPAVQRFDPALGPAVGFVAALKDHGFVRDPGGYVAALAQALEQAGGRLVTADVTGIAIHGGRVREIETAQGPIPCDAAVLASGAWSKPLIRRLGLDVPIETERGYHIVYEGAEGAPAAPTMVAAGKFVATPMAGGLRCAGILEFGGLEAGPRAGPLALLRRRVVEAFPSLRAAREVEWMGHRPAPSDSLPLIGEIGRTRVFAAFGHHHIGITAGPKTGRIVAGLVSGEQAALDLGPYAPDRFAG